MSAGIVLTNDAANEGTTYASSKLSASSVVTTLGGTAVVPESVLTDLNAAQTAAAAATKAAALAKIDGIALDGDATGVIAQDLIDAGVTASVVIEANLVAHQTAISTAADLSLDNTDKIQQMVTDVNTNTVQE